jgi:hypothetical protein
MRLGIPALLSVLLFGCGGSDAGIFEDKNDGATSTEETSTTDDTGGTTTDTSIVEDSGGSTVDGDPPPPIDSGMPTKDTGALPDTAPPPPLDTGVTTCPEPSGKIFGGHCYFPTMARTWLANRDVCNTLKAHLVTINTDAEQAFVNSISSGDRWIGLGRAEGSPFEKSSYKWITGEPVSYSNWESSEPNFSGNCVRLRGDGLWADYSCSQTLSAICERE